MTTVDGQEHELLARVAQGDADALGGLYDRLAGPMYSLALQILRDATGAEDVVQEAFVQLWEKGGTYDRSLGRPLTWALTLVRNRSIDRLRSMARRQRVTEAAASEAGAAEATAPPADVLLTGRETAGRIQRVLEQVPGDQRQAIEMAYYQGLTQTEIAAALGVPLGTVKARIRRGMLLMRDLLADDSTAAGLAGGFTEPT